MRCWVQVLSSSVSRGAEPVNPAGTAPLSSTGKVTRRFFVYGSPKNVQDNVRDDEQEQFKRAAKLTLALTDEQLRLLIEKGQFEEIFNHAQEIPK